MAKKSGNCNEIQLICHTDLTYNFEGGWILFLVLSAMSKTYYFY